MTNTGISDQRTALFTVLRLAKNSWVAGDEGAAMLDRPDAGIEGLEPDLASVVELARKLIQEIQRMWLLPDAQQLLDTLVAPVEEPPQLRLRVLGQMEAMWQGEIVNLPRHGIKMLTLLVLAEPVGMTGSELRELLYGASDAGHSGLRKLLERLRRLMPGVIVLDGANYRLNVRQERLDADVLLVRDTPLACEDQAVLQRAAEYASRTLLPGHEDAWVRGERQALMQRGVDLWLALANLARKRNDMELAVRSYQAARALGPLQERVIATAMSLDLELGRPVQAVNTFLEYQQLLDDQLGLSAPAQIEMLYRTALDA